MKHNAMPFDDIILFQNKNKIKRFVLLKKEI